MNIVGLQKTTLLDYPEHVAATIFLGGCNMRCHFCHNMNLVMSCDNTLDSNDVLRFLKSRQGILDGVCITGGEPTLYHDLPDFIASIRALGLKVKLDTNGTNPVLIKDLLANGCLDYIAMDIKSSISTYEAICGTKLDTNAILNCIQIIINSQIPYEFRTTIVKQYHTEEVIRDIACMLNGATSYYLQNFIDSEYVPNHELESVDADTIKHYIEILSEHIDNVSARGIILD